MPSPLLATAFSTSSHFANVTVVGWVNGPPETVWPMLSDPVCCGVFGDVKSIKELRRAAPRLHGRQLVSELEVEQVARLHVLRVPVDARMRVRLDCNHTAKQVRLRLVSGNMFMRSFDGLYAVMPLSCACSACCGGAQLSTASAAVAEAVGADTWHQLSSRLAGTCAAGSPGAQQQGQHAQQRQYSTQERSLVVLHQRLQPAVPPPFGLGGFVRGQVRRQFEHMYNDLQRACEAAHRE